jgi:hypothetical protein
MFAEFLLPDTVERDKHTWFSEISSIRRKVCPGPVISSASFTSVPRTETLLDTEQKPTIRNQGEGSACIEIFRFSLRRTIHYLLSSEAIRHYHHPFVLLRAPVRSTREISSQSLPHPNNVPFA